jgi:sulfite exporter TauE/SafE
VSAAFYVAALSMGLLGGAHCVVMCGGVVGSICATGSSSRRASHALLYNAGRIASYATAGAVAGGVGALASSFGAVYGAQVALRVIAGVLALTVGLYLAGVWRGARALERAAMPIWRRVEPFAKTLVPVESAGAALALGALWGWLPCGLVYAALALAVTSATPIAGALTMAAFGVGTLPTLLAMGAAASALARVARRAWVRRVAGLALAAMGSLNLLAAAAPLGIAALPGATLVHQCCAVKR